MTTLCVDVGTRLCQTGQEGPGHRGDAATVPRREAAGRGSHLVPRGSAARSYAVSAVLRPVVLTNTPRRSRHAVAGSRPHGYRARVPPPSTRGPGRPSTCAALPGGLQNGESVPAWELGEVASGPAQPQGSSGRRGLRGVGAAGLRRHAERARRTHSPASATARPSAFLKPRFLFPEKTNKQTNTRSVSGRH